MSITLRQPVLVTGGCGFVGRHVVRYLIEAGVEDIWVVDDLSTGQRPEEWLAPDSSGDAGQQEFHADGARITFLQGDVRDYLRRWSSDGGPGFGDVIHLASIVGGRTKIEKDPVSVAADYAIDSDLFLWATKARPDRLLYASSSAAYPIRLQDETGPVALKEDFINFDGSLGQPDMTYGWAKVTGEFLARLTAEHYGISTACVRPFSGYGEDQDLTYPVPAIAQRAARREDPLVIWGSGKQGRDFVHIDDCVEAMFLVLDRVSDGSGVNLGSGVLTTFEQVAQTYADIAGYSPEIKALADKPMGVHARYADTELSRKLLDWEPKISLTDGLTRVYEQACRNEQQARKEA